MDYEQKARMAADCLLSYRDDRSGWQVCKKSVRFDFTCLWFLNDTCFQTVSFMRMYVFVSVFCLASLSKILLGFVFSLHFCQQIAPRLSVFGTNYFK